MDLLLHMGRQALIPPPNSGPFERPSYIRPDNVGRMGNEFYAQALGHASFNQQLAAASQPGALGTLGRMQPGLAPYTRFMQNSMHDPDVMAAAGALPGVRNALPYL